MAYRMTPARRAALRKAQIASARKRRKGFKGKASTFKKTVGPKRQANKQLRKSAFKKARTNAKASRTAKRARRASVRSTAARNKAAALGSKSKRLRQKQTRIQTGKQGAYLKRRKARRKAIRRTAFKKAK
jgi:hypothetical protein